MGFNTLLLLAAIWLIWTSYLNSRENIERQRQLKSQLDQLSAQINSGGHTKPQKSGEPINLNTASKAQLQSLPRIGAISTKHIIAARPFESADQLKAVTGITHAVFDAIKDRVTL